MSQECPFRAFLKVSMILKEVYEKMVCFVHNAFYLPFRQVILVFQLAKSQPMYKPVNQDLSISLAMYVFLNQSSYLAVCIFLHFLLRLVLRELLFLRRLTVIRAIDNTPFPNIICNAVGTIHGHAFVVIHLPNIEPRNICEEQKHRHNNDNRNQSPITTLHPRKRTFVEIFFVHDSPLKWIAIEMNSIHVHFSQW